MKCPSCGATIVDDSLVCSYCHTPTPLANQKRAAEVASDVQEQQRRSEEEAARAAEHESNARESMRRTSLHALIWSIVGIFTCCLPVPSIVSLVLSIRARKMAKNYGFVLPMNATVGLGFSILGLLMAIGLYAFAISEQVRMSNRIDELTLVANEGETAPSLDNRTACALAEIRLLTDGYGGKTESIIDDFDCPGNVTQSGDHAELEDITFHAGHDNRIRVRGCYKKGARWILEGFRTTAACNEPEAEPTL